MRLKLQRATTSCCITAVSALFLAVVCIGDDSMEPFEMQGLFEFLQQGEVKALEFCNKIGEVKALITVIVESRFAQSQNVEKISNSAWYPCRILA